VAGEEFVGVEGATANLNARLYDPGRRT